MGKNPKNPTNRTDNQSAEQPTEQAQAVQAEPTSAEQPTEQAQAVQAEPTSADPHATEKARLLAEIAALAGEGNLTAVQANMARIAEIDRVSASLRIEGLTAERTKLIGERDKVAAQLKSLQDQIGAIDSQIASARGTVGASAAVRTAGAARSSGISLIVDGVDMGSPTKAAQTLVERALGRKPSAINGVNWWKLTGTEPDGQTFEREYNGTIYRATVRRAAQ